MEKEGKEKEREKKEGEEKVEKATEKGGKEREEARGEKARGQNIEGENGKEGEKEKKVPIQVRKRKFEDTIPKRTQRTDSATAP